MRWVHSAVDYLAAAVGGDGGRGCTGAVGERVMGNPPCVGRTGGNGVCMPGPSGDWCACPPTQLPAAPSHSSFTY